MFFKTTLATVIACVLGFGTQSALAHNSHPHGSLPVHQQGSTGRGPLGGSRNFGFTHGPQPVHNFGGAGRSPLGGMRNFGFAHGPQPMHNTVSNRAPLGGGGAHPSRGRSS